MLFILEHDIRIDPFSALLSKKNPLMWIVAGEPLIWQIIGSEQVLSIGSQDDWSDNFLALVDVDKIQKFMAFAQCDCSQQRQKLPAEPTALLFFQLFLRPFVQKPLKSLRLAYFFLGTVAKVQFFQPIVGFLQFASFTPLTALLYLPFYLNQCQCWLEF